VSGNALKIADFQIRLAHVEGVSPFRPVQPWNIGSFRADFARVLRLPINVQPRGGFHEQTEAETLEQKRIVGDRVNRTVKIVSVVAHLDAQTLLDIDGQHPVVKRERIIVGFLQSDVLSSRH
jgi:hypothetical protein